MAAGLCASELRGPRQRASSAGSVERHFDAAGSRWQRARMPSEPTKELETFPNPNPKRAYEIRFACPEFTCLCPKTGQPDFATIRIRYTPADTCVELKSLKLYLWAYRNEGAFHEAVTNKILDDLVAAVAPRSMTVEGDFMVRGGIHTVVEASYTIGDDV